MIDQSISIISLTPPLLVLIIGLTTRKVMTSLLLGIALAALIANNFQILPSIDLIAKTIWSNLELTTLFSVTDFWHTSSLFICCFLLVIGIIVTLLQHSGAANAYHKFATKHITDARSAETSSLILSTCLFIDDYFSSLTVGTIMQPLTDKYKVSRVKLSFLVDSMAAPLAILCPFSSWVAAIIGFLKENGIVNDLQPSTLIHANPINVYFNLLPFIFYSFLLIFTSWYIVKYRISFAKMYSYEKHNKVEYNENPTITTSSKLSDFYLPILFLIVSIFVSFLYSGSWQILGGNHSFMYALQHANAAVGLFIGGNLALIIITIFLVGRNLLTIRVIPKCYSNGIKLMMPAIIILLLAWSLGDILRQDLHTGKYLANLIIDKVNIVFLPSILFIISTIIAFAIGSSWGTAATIFPIAVPMIISLSEFQGLPQANDLPILFPALGAILSGCVAGDHISPISDTSIMTATSCKVPLLDHIYTQLPYALIIIVITAICFIIASLLANTSLIISSIVPLVIGMLSLVIIFKLYNCEQ